MPAPVRITSLDTALAYAGDPPERIPFPAGDERVQASLTVDPTGADNVVDFTARDPGVLGNRISVAYAAPAATAETLVSVAGPAITVTPGSKARMVITGTAEANGTLSYSEGSAGSYHFISADGYLDLIHDGAVWTMTALDEFSINIYTATKESAASTPEGLTGWAVTNGSGSPIVAAGVSDAQQVLDAVYADEAASALVLSAGSAAVTGAVAAVAAAFLTGGSGGPDVPVRVVI